MPQSCRTQPSPAESRRAESLEPDRTVAAAALTLALLTPSLAHSQDQSIATDPTPVLALAAGPFERDLRISGPDGLAPYLVVAGIERNVEPGPLGLEVVPLLVLASGTLDIAGNALVPLDLMDRAHAGLQLHFQAVAAPVYTQMASDLLISPALTLTAKAPETRGPDDSQSDRIYVSAALDHEQAEALLVYADGDFPEIAAEIEITVPTGGYEVTDPVVRWNEDFARIAVTVVRPRPDDIVSQGFVTHRLRVILGSRVDQAEVSLAAAVAEPPAGHR